MFTPRYRCDVCKKALWNMEDIMFIAEEILCKNCALKEERSK